MVLQFLSDLAHQTHGRKHRTTSDTHTSHSQLEQLRSGWSPGHCQEIDWTGNVPHQGLDDGQVDDIRHKNAIRSCLKIGPAPLNGFLCWLLGLSVPTNCATSFKAARLVATCACSGGFPSARLLRDATTLETSTDRPRVGPR